MNAIRTFLKKHDRLWQSLRFVKHWITDGRQEAVRVINEHREELRIREELYRKTLLTEEEKTAQQNTTFPDPVQFSILVPLYNTPETYLIQMLDSVKNQTYPNWELCLADGSDEAHAYVQRICESEADKDPRIQYQKLQTNEGISGNTNRCIRMATGDWYALFDHDDLLHPSALFEMMKVISAGPADLIYTDENTFSETPKDAFNPHFKPDYAPDNLRANNYICHFTAFRKELLEKAGGGFRPEFDGSQDHDLILRLTEQAEHIVHIPKILYYWRAHKGSTAEAIQAKPYVIEAGKKAVQAHLDRLGLKGSVGDGPVPSMYRLKYELTSTPLVSILIPNKDHRDDLKRCIDSIKTKTTYPNYEIIVIENNSTEPETFAYYETLKQDPKIKVITYDKPFNYSAVNNVGAGAAEGEQLLLLNNDTEVLSPDWIQEMLMYAQREDVGAVGAKLYYPDGTIQHAGIGIGIKMLAGHWHKNFPKDHPGYFGRLTYAQNVSAVTAACMMVPARVYKALGGLDESFSVVFNDVDLCLRIREAGYLIVWTPWAELTHYESKSRGSDEDTPEKKAFFVKETNRFQRKWNKTLTEGDPYYNPNLTREKEDFSPR